MDSPIDKNTWHQLRDRLRPFIVSRSATLADADDILQDAMLRMHRGLPKLRDDQRLGAWMFQVARSAIADHARKSARTPLADHDAPESTDESFDEDSVAELARCVGLLAHRLPEPYREALVLTELRGLAQREAADIAGISLSGMKSRVQRGRAKLREMLQACCVVAVDSRGSVSGCEARSRDGMPAKSRDLTRC